MERTYKTPASRLTGSSLRASAVKRDSLAAGLERDPELSTAKRKQRTEAFTSHMAQASLERQLVAAQAAKVELETKLRERDASIERLESDRRYLSEREKQEREEKERERAERDEEKRKSDSDIRALRNSYMALREQHAELEDSHASLSRDTSQTIANQEAQITMLQRQLTLVQSELTETKDLVSQREHTLSELRHQVDDLSSAAADTSRMSVAEDEESWAVIREELHRQTDHMRTVEAENARTSSEIAILRQRHDNAEVLREQIRELEHRARDTDELREKVARLEGDLDATKRERDDLASRQTESQTPVAVTQSLSSLRVTYAKLLEQHSETSASLRRREIELEDAQCEAQEAQGLASKYRAERDSLRDKTDRHAHRAQLAEREVNFLRSMVASFTAEEATQEGVKVEDMTSERVEHLQSLVNDYKSTIAIMEKKIEDLGGDSPALLGGRLPKDLVAELDAEKTAKLAAQQALEEAQTEIETHLEKIEELEQKLFDLQGEIGGGRHVPPSTRVLTMRVNPAQEWADLSQAAMDRLKTENEALLKRLKELEESGATVTGQGQGQEELVPRESWENVVREKEELEAEVKQSQKKLLRLRQVFTTKTDEFKTAIGEILGVKLAFAPNGQVRVTSTFDLSTAFVFQPTNSREGEGMRMQLVAQSEAGSLVGADELPQLMRYWVEQEQCIPGFLASVTLQLYEKRKMDAEQQH